MPELPEVETVVRELCAAGVPGSRVVSVSVRDPRAIEGATPTELAYALKDRNLGLIGRRGKYIVIPLYDGRTLLVHLRMTGRLFVENASFRPGPHDRVTLEFDDGRFLVFRDTRRFGRWRLTAEPERVLGRLGPEPLMATFTARALAGRLAGHSGRLKPLLLNQSVLAGLGNIYVDEALWEAGLHPTRRANSLSVAETVRLHAAIRLVLRRGVRNGGTSLGLASTNFKGATGRAGRNRAHLAVFRRTGLPCPRCGEPIARMVVAQRGTHICVRCQPACR